MTAIDIWTPTKGMRKIVLSPLTLVDIEYGQEIPANL